MYLISSLQGLIQERPQSEALLAAHIRLLMQAGQPPAKVCKIAQKYTRKAPNSSRVWLARLLVEQELGTSTIGDVWAEARKQVQGSEEDMLRVWTWGLGRVVGDREAQKKVHEVSEPIWTI